MKIIIWMVSITCVLYSSIAMSCESNIFNIYYLPLEAEFYVPPTREYMLQHGINIKINSCAITSIFKTISEQKGVEPQSEDYKRLRILILGKKDDSEIFITSDKTVISRDKKYMVDVKVVDEALKEIVDLINVQPDRSD